MSLTHRNGPERLLAGVLALGMIAASVASALAQNAITHDFETAGQWTGNFRAISGTPTGTVGQTTSGGNGIVRYDITGGNQATAYLFDQTPTDTTAATQSTIAVTGNITVSFRARTNTSNTSFGVIFADPSNFANNVSGLVNVLTGADQVRFWRDGTPATAGAGIGTQVGTTSTPGVVEPDGSTWTTVTVTLSTSGATPTLVINWGGANYTSAFAAGDYDFANGKTVVILRFYDNNLGASNIDIDNIVINSPGPPDNPPGPPEENTAPSLPFQADRSVAALDTLVVTNTGSDSNTPAQTLTYQLTTAPAGASISSSGIITWTPGPSDVSGTPYTFTTLVTDNGTPALTATNSFQVTVTDAPVFDYVQSMDFTAASDFTGNFRAITNIGGGTLGVSNGTLNIDARSSGGSTSAVLLYDRTPDDSSIATQTAFPTNQQLRISFLARAATTGSSFTVSFADPRNVGNRVSGQFVINTGDDTVRFYRDGSITATSSSNGTQVGGDITFDAGAEPNSGSFVPVTMVLTVNGTTPTLTISAGTAAPVTSTFAAGDIDWNPTLVMLRFGDPSTSAGALEIDNLLVAGGTPVIPPAPVLPPAPGADGNLITVNPSFESGSLNNFSGSYSFTGWTGTNALYSSHAINTGSVAAGTTTHGVKYLRQSWGGTLSTALTARPPATAGTTYELSYDQRSLVRNFPSEKLGSIPMIEFFDPNGVRIKQVWGTANNYKVQYKNINTWETFTLRAVAPAGTAYVGLFFNNPAGRYVDSTHDYTQDRHVDMDNIRLKVIPETADRIGYRRAPRLVEPGRVALLRLNHATPASRILRAALLDSSGTVRASAQTTVASGRYRNTSLPVSIPADLPDGTYSWRLQILPAGGTGNALATLNPAGVICDESVAAPTAANGTDFDADHPRIRFMGRIENTNPKQQWLHWFGSEVFVRFSGTSLALRGSITDNGYGSAESTNLLVVVDEDYTAPITVPLNSFNYVKTLVSGLTDGKHTARLFKSSETDISIRVDGFRVDAGRGLFVPEPHSSRRIEIFGDSVTSGGTASPAYNGYAPLLGRELDADVHIVSKGGTGVASSFAGQDILVNYYDNLSFPNVFNASGAGSLPWDFNRWKAGVVVCAIGHNDQFNNGLATFNSRYAEFKGYIRAAYPNAPFITANTLISANLSQFQNAVDPLAAVDPLHTFAFQPNSWSDSATAHPPTAGHAAQIYGDERRYSLAEVVEDQAGWGFGAPGTAYDQWAAAAFTPGVVAQELQLPEADADLDGISNFMEFALGGNPADPSSAPKFSVSTGTTSTLDLAFFKARSDLSYIIERSTNLMDWSPFSNNRGSVGGTVTVTDNIVPGENRFYRLRVTEF